jgi:hypothetical protein
MRSLLLMLLLAGLSAEASAVPAQRSHAAAAFETVVARGRHR